MPINLSYSPTDSTLSVILPSWMMILNPPIQKCQWKRNQILLTWTSPLAILPVSNQYLRDSEEWVSTYKIRTIVERSINHFKNNMYIAGRKNRNHTTTKADVFLAGIASQLTVIVAYRMNRPKYIRSLKPVIA